MITKSVYQEIFNPSFMNPEEINFILVEPAVKELSSPTVKKGVRSEMVDMLKMKRNELLLLPFHNNKG